MQRPPIKREAITPPSRKFWLPNLHQEVEGNVDEGAGNTQGKDRNEQFDNRKPSLLLHGTIPCWLQSKAHSAEYAFD